MYSGMCINVGVVDALSFTFVLRNPGKSTVNFP